MYNFKPILVSRIWKDIYYFHCFIFKIVLCKWWIKKFKQNNNTDLCWVLVWVVIQGDPILDLSMLQFLKLPSLFTAWLIWTFHTKSHNMKALAILSHLWSPFLPLTYLYGNKWMFVGLCAAFWSIFLRRTPSLSWVKNSPQITHTNHMTMTTSGWIWSWPDYCKTKENVNIILLDLCLFAFYFSTCQWVHMAMAINRPDILLMYYSDEKHLQNYSCLI